MMSSMLPFMLLFTAENNRLVNPRFEAGLEGWRKETAQATIELTKMDGRTAVRIAVPEGAEPGPHGLYQEVAAVPGEVLVARGEVLRTKISSGAGAYIEIAYYGADGQRLAALPEDYAVTSGHWTTLHTPLHHMIAVPKDCAKVRLYLAFSGHGEAYFDNLMLVSLPRPAAPAPAPAGPVTLNVTDQVVCPALFGFGAEDDGWFHLEKNIEEGVTEEDNALREERIRWIKPEWIRTFIWIPEWCPSGDLETFDFDTAGMRSHYRSLDLYQKLGARVNLVDVEWKLEGIYDDPARVARAVGALFEHLIKVKGYTCIKYWTLTNEPDSNFSRQRAYRFDHFLKIHRLVKEEFKKRGLQIQIVGSDDADARAFYETCVADPEYFALTDIFCSHTYPRSTALFAVPEYFDSRLRPLEAKQPVKPFIVGELGFLGEHFTSHDNPLMLTYPYAIWSSAFVIEGLNRGVAGFSIWTMNEVYYPGGGKMQFGLWDFKDKGWTPRPVYYAWANFCRLTRAGDAVRRCDSSSPERVIGAVVGKTLFWVNRSDQPAEVIVTGLKASEARIMQESTLAGDRECGVLAKLKEGRFTAPPQSFGYAR